jgi:hypothetical protein
MRAGPLDDPRLRAIEQCLDAGRYDDAQRRLAALVSVPGLDQGGIAYLSARLLFYRGRLDATSVAVRLRDVLRACPDFAEAVTWLETVERSAAVTKPPPSRLETPRIPYPPPAAGFASPRPVSLGSLALPKSEAPTDPAPPNPDEHAAPVTVEPPHQQPSPWDPLEVALAGGRRDAVLGGLDKLAARELDALLGRKKPKFGELAGEVSSWLSRAPITRAFGPFDFTLDSVERLDAIVALLVPPGITQGFYALRVSFAVYLGECVRQAADGTWEGTLAEPENAGVLREAGRYVPWAEIDAALGAGQPLRGGVGPPPHPAAEPPSEIVSVSAEMPTPWDPRQWPTLAEMKNLTRALASSTLGVWAARCLKIPLDRTPGSLRALDRYATLLNPRGKSPGSTAAWVRHAAVLTGGYVGELLCLHAAGRFNENDTAPEGPLRFEVILPSGSAVYPVLFAYERFAGKRWGNFSKLFDEQVTRT